MDNQFHLNSNQLAGTQGGHCDAASCGARGPNECVNQASNVATNSGDYLRIEGAFSFNAAAGATQGGGGRKGRLMYSFFVKPCPQTLSPPTHCITLTSPKGTGADTKIPLATTTTQ